MPSPLWGVSAYRLLKRSDWERIRRGVLAEAENACSVCGVVRESRMRCDEDWEYDEATGVALLAGLRILCPDDAVTHIGFTGTRGYAHVAYEHMARVNGTSVREARAASSRAMLMWRKLSTRSWLVAVAPELLEAHPALSILVGRTGAPKAVRDPATSDVARRFQDGHI